MNFTDIFSIVGNGLIGIDAIVRTKVTNHKVKEIIDAAVQAVYAGIKNIDDTVHKAISEIEQGKDPDFTPDIPPSPTLPPLAPDSNPPNWFKIAWKILSPVLSLVARKWPKFAEYYAPLKAAGDKLVEVLSKYFPHGSEGDTIEYKDLKDAIAHVDRAKFPPLSPPSKPDEY